MAEIRKHKPHTSAIGDQVREAIGGVPRPNRPGERPEGEDPFFAEELTGAQGAGAAAAKLPAAGQLGGFTLRVSDRSGLVSLGTDQVRALASVIREETDVEADDGTDEPQD